MKRHDLVLPHAFRQPIIRLLSGLILASCLGSATLYSAPGEDTHSVLPHYDPLLSATTAATPIPRSTLAQLSPSDQQALARGETVTVLVEFDQSAAQTLAAQRRRQARVVHDTPAILAQRVRLYRQQKDRVLNSLSAIPFTVQRDYTHLPMSVLRLSPMALSALARQPGVRAIHSEQMLRPLLDRSLPLIRQPEVAAQGATGAGTTVAVLDTGVDYTRAAFGSCTAPGGDCRVVVAQDFGGDDNSLDDNGHGTNVAGIVLGVAPGARIAALDVFGTGLATSFDVIEGIDWSIANRDTYNIVAMNLSLGSGSFQAPCDDPLNPFFTPLVNARSAGILAAAAAGNDGKKNALTSPACVSATISVGAVYDSDVGSTGWSNCSDATTRADQATCFSNSADFLTLLAPGSKITAADITASGTSMAAPHVAGAIAVLRAAHGDEPLDSTVLRLTSTGVPITDVNDITVPRLDLAAALGSSLEIYPLTVIRDGDGEGRVRSQPGGIDCGDTCEAGFPRDATVTLSAIPAPGAGFAGWGGACDGTALTCELSMDAARTVTASFTGITLAEALDNTELLWETYGDSHWQGVQLAEGDAARSGDVGWLGKTTLTTTVVGPGELSFRWRVSSQPDNDLLAFWVDDQRHGVISGEQDWQNYAITLDAGFHQIYWHYSRFSWSSAGENAGWVDAVSFTPTATAPPDLTLTEITGPDRAGPGGPLQVSATVVNQSPVGVPIFLLSFFLSADTSIDLEDTYTGWSCEFRGLGGGERAFCSGEITIPAEVAPGEYFLGAYVDSREVVTESREDNNGRAAATPLTVEQDLPRLVVVLEGDGQGRVVSDPAGIDCGDTCAAAFARDSTVRLIPTAAAGSVFSGWRGACQGNGVCGLGMSGDQQVTATFHEGSAVILQDGFE